LEEKEDSDLTCEVVIEKRKKQNMKTTTKEDDFVRTLLSAQDEWDAGAAAPAPAPRKRQRKAIKSTKPGTPLSEADVLRLHVASMLVVDRCMTGSSQHKDDTKYRRQVQAAQFHSRSRAAVPEPTFNKQRHAAAQKEASLQKIAKLLQKQSKKRSIS
jgi:hypothetical protein